MPSDSDPVPEQLIIVTGRLSDEALKRLRQRCEVTQSMSSGVFLIRGEPGLGGPTPDGVHVFSTPDVPDEILSSLDEREALFVAAWQSRLQQPPKKRPGDGLDWDDPEFKPPI